ncbi:MAG: hypothetical protein K6E71_02790 [Lachnospiraceae bacterium]|nr:hypothetical protein [Lachnospiraceae bacterium]
MRISRNLVFAFAAVIMFSMTSCGKTSDTNTTDTPKNASVITPTTVETEPTKIGDVTDPLTPTITTEIKDPMEGNNGALDRIFMESKQAMSVATHLMVVKFLGTETDDYGTKVYLFSPQRVLKGILEGDENTVIYAIANDEDSKSFTNFFNKVTEYLLSLEKHISVHEPRSTFIFYDNVFSSDDEQWSGILASAEQIAAETADSVPPYYGNAFTVSTDINEIIDFATNVFVVKAEHFISAARHSTELYYFTVTKTWKNTPSGNGQIYLAVPEGIVTCGESYVVLLSGAEKTSPVYTVAAKTNSVFSLKEAAGIPAIAKILEEATPYTPQ